MQLFLSMRIRCWNGGGGLAVSRRVLSNGCGGPSGYIPSAS